MMPLFVEAALFQWINPKSWIVSASAAGTYLQPGSGTAVSQSLHGALHGVDIDH